MDSANRLCRWLLIEIIKNYQKFNPEMIRKKLNLPIRRMIKMIETNVNNVNNLAHEFE